MTKSELRKEYLSKRSALSPDERSEASRKIADRFFQEVDLRSVRVLHCFISIPKLNEIDTSVIYERVWDEFPGVMTAAPRMPKSGEELDHIAFDANSIWVENKWGIREPSGGVMVDPSEIDTVIVPLLCFDTSGYRVGYGKGYYDRFLARCRPDLTKIGVSYLPPISEIIDVNNYDVVMDACITPEATFRFS